MTPSFPRIASFKSPAEFRAHLQRLHLTLPCDDQVTADSPLGEPVPGPLIAGKRIGNRFAIQPMEGWDGTVRGAPTELVRRRWQRFGAGGAKLIWGGEAMAVCPEGRANPNQLILNEDNCESIAGLRRLLVEAHHEAAGGTADLLVGFQLTHSGRFCRPNDKARLEPKIAFRHPLLDARWGIQSDDPVISDAEVERLIAQFVQAAALAHAAGADFADLKHCHGYLLHEFLGAHTRPGPYGGTFENRTRILREIVRGIRSSGNPIEIGVRLSAFDFVPFRPDPAGGSAGKKGPGVPEAYGDHLPYRYGFGVNPNHPVEPHLEETFLFQQLCVELGVRLMNYSAGSPYYNPHIQRPAAYPPSDGYQPAGDPLVDVARQVEVVRRLKTAAPESLVVVGSGYSYLQEYLPHVAQAVVRAGWTDLAGLGRMVLSYPGLPLDVLQGKPFQKRLLCRTFSDCTTAPRNGMVSGCYPLDPHYAALPEAARLKALKRGTDPSPPPEPAT